MTDDVALLGLVFGNHVFTNARTAYEGACHIPLGRFSMLDCSTPKRVPVLIPNHTSSEISRGDASSAVLYGTDTNSDCCGDTEHGKSTQGRVVSSVVYSGRGGGGVGRAYR